MSPKPSDIASNVPELIGQRLGRDRKEIEEALSGYVSELRESLQETGFVEVRGFGVFTFNDGRIEFEPDGRLEEAINFRYAGLEALSISPVSHADSLVSHEETGVSEIDPTDVVSEMAAKTVSVEVDSETAGPPGSVDWLPISEQVLPDNQKSESSEPVSHPELAPRPERTPANRDRSGDKSKHPSRSTSPSGTGNTRRRRAILLIVVPLIVIGAAIGGIAIYNSLPGEDESPTFTSSEDPSADNPLVAPDDNASQAPGQPLPGDGSETIPDDAEIDPVSEETSGVNPPPVSDEAALGADPPPQEDSAFVSDFDRSATGYTLMVGSVFNDVDAQNGIARFSQVDLPKAVLTYEENGIIRYRLALGRFNTIESAQEEIARLGNRIPSDTWVYRIR